MSAVVNDLEQPVDTNNPLVNIHHNEILMNGNTAGDTAGGGGGISIYTGARGYRVANNYIAGNYSTGDGGGMAHFGTSGAINCGNSFPQDNRSGSSCASTVSNNQFRFNQSFSQAKSAQGGGLAVVGIYDTNQNNGVTFGTGSLVIVNNVFQGNLAGAGDGGGIALVGVNGSLDVNSRNRNNWNRVDILGNVITNNGAGVAGGGISLQDAGNVHIVNNTVSMNDSFATAARAFTGGTGLNNPDPLTLISASVLQNGAGIAAYGNSAGLRAVIQAGQRQSQPRGQLAVLLRCRHREQRGDGQPQPHLVDQLQRRPDDLLVQHTQRATLLRPECGG